MSEAYAKPADISEANSFLKPFSFLGTSARPVRSEHYLSPGGHFMIHYDNSGYDAVPQNYTYHDTVPDFVFKAAEYLDASYRMLHDSLGFSTPPTDHSETPEIDVYFKKDYQNYGVTWPEIQIRPYVWTSYLTLSTLLGDSTIFYTYGLNGLKVTCAHELFHVFQLGYKFRNKDLFFFEMSSVWFEEYMYPDVNDYHSYMNAYSLNWDYALNSNLGLNPYNSAGFNLYIDKRHSIPGNNIIHTIWERIPAQPALEAIDTELLLRGSSFGQALCNWGTAQVLCGGYSAENFVYAFNDAADLSSIGFGGFESHITSALSLEFSLSADTMTSYYKFTDLPQEALLLEAEIPEGVRANLVCLDGSSSRVLTLGSGATVVDGSRYSACILVLGSTVEGASGNVSLSAVTSPRITSLYPNPLL
ncbi:MAG: hypothetical protein JXR21_00415, partial [Candidatus Marinimicrobia bacterium]|nr:hypothetical protein [Candidatus Neomarinimicrobiota bacterium]